MERMTNGYSDFSSRGEETVESTAGKASPRTLISVLRGALRLLFSPCRLAGRHVLRYFYPELSVLDPNAPACAVFPNSLRNTRVSASAKIYPPYHINDSSIGDYSGIARNAAISRTQIGKFCSIGPNFCCGWGIHPTTGISTAPMFYSTRKQNGISLSKTDKILERQPISIGNDVFIGMNVIVMDGVRIGDGAIVGAGCVVRSDVPPYALAVGNPMRVMPRFSKETAAKLQRIAWWNWPDEQLQEVEKYFFDVEGFCARFTAPSDMTPTEAGPVATAEGDAEG